MYATLIVLFQTLSKDPNGPKPWEDPLNADTPDMYWWGNLMLVVLLTLHTWWFWLFLKLLYGLLTTDAHESGRENYEGDSTDEVNTHHARLLCVVVALPPLCVAMVTHKGLAADVTGGRQHWW